MKAPPLPMQINITINIDNAAFQDDLNDEMSMILDRCAAYLENMAPGQTRVLLDSNGNTVGSLKLR